MAIRIETSEESGDINTAQQRHIQPQNNQPKTFFRIFENFMIMIEGLAMHIIGSAGRACCIACNCLKVGEEQSRV